MRNLTAKKLTVCAVFLLMMLPSALLAGTPLTASLTAAPATVVEGQSTVLSWNSTGDGQCFLHPGIGPVSASGTMTVKPGCTTVYTLWVKNARGFAKSEAKVFVNRPPVAFFSALPKTIFAGQKARLYFSSLGATSVSISPNVGAVGACGMKEVSPASTTTYTLTATGSGGTVTKTATVSVTPMPTGGLTIFEKTCAVRMPRFYIGTSVFKSNAYGTAYLTVTKTTPDKRVNSGTIFLNGDGISLDSFLEGSDTVFRKPVSVRLLNFFSIALTGQYKAALNVKIAFECPDSAPQVSLSANPLELVRGESSTLSWSSVNADSCVLEPGGVALPPSGSLTVTPTDTTTYIITATGPGGSATSYVTVNVYNRPEATFSANPAAIILGESSVLAWTTTDAESVSISPDVGLVAPGGSAVVTPGETTTYVLTATGRGGTVTASALVTVHVPPTAMLSVEPAAIIAGQSATLSWTSQNADTVSIEPGIGTVSPNGTLSVSPSETTSYTITATGPGGVAKKSVTVTVYQIPTASLTVLPAAIIEGESATLSWSAAHADTVFIEPGIGQVDPSGTRSISPSESTTYTITATGPGGTVKASATLTVYHVPTVSLSVSEASIIEGQKATLAWSSSNAYTLSIEPGIGVVSSDGNLEVSPSETTSYTITATGPGGVARASATLVVYHVPTATLAVSPGTIIEGNQATLSWNTAHAETVTIEPGIGQVDPSGTRSISPSESTSYTITATGLGGTTRAYATLTVYHVPTVTVSASSALITLGQNVTITWSSTHASACSISPGETALAPSGSITITPTESATYTVTATGPGGYATASVAVKVNRRPVADAGESRIVNMAWDQETAEVTLSGAGSTDSDGQVASYFWTGSPDPDDSASPTLTLSEGVYVFTLSVTDETGATSEPDQVTITVDRAYKPVLTAPASVAAAEGSQVTVTVSGTDQDGDSLTFSASSLTRGASFDPASKILTWIPDFDQAGSYTISFTVSDNTGLYDTQNVTVFVAQTNRPPVFTSGAVTSAEADYPYSYQARGADPDNDPITYALDHGPVGMSVDQYSGLVSWLPLASHAGTQEAAIKVTDSLGSSAVQVFQIEVAQAEDRQSPMASVFAPSSVAASTPFFIGIDAADNVGVSRVSLYVDGLFMQDFVAAPFRFSCTAPSVSGKNLDILAIARDGAGNTTEARTSVSVVSEADSVTPQVLKVIAPQSAAPGEKVRVGVIASDDRGVSRVRFIYNDQAFADSYAPPFAAQFSVPANLSAGSTAIVAVEVLDAQGNAASATAAINIIENPDTTAPQGVTVSAPSIVKPGEAVELSATGADSGGLFSMEFFANGALIGTSLEAPYKLAWTVPYNAAPGSRINFTARAVDFSGNHTDSAEFSATVAALGRGFIIGEAFDDATSLPVAGADVIVSTAGGRDLPAPLRTVTDLAGRYSLELSEGLAVIRVIKDGYTISYRSVYVAADAVTEPLDARLTPISPSTEITGLSGGTVSLDNGAVTLTVPAGAFGETRQVTFTRLSAQGLPGPLPLGWTPVSAFAAGPFGWPVNLALSITATGLTNVGNSPQNLVAAWWDPVKTQWVRAESSPANNGVRAVMPGFTSVVFARPDAGLSAPALPQVGQALPGVAAIPIPADAVAQISSSPDILFMQPGQKSRVAVSLASSVGLPSGTVIRADFDESYLLLNGQKLLCEPRGCDIILYRTEGGLAGEFIASPSRSFDPALLNEGGIELSVNRPGEALGLGVLSPAGGTVIISGASLSLGAGLLDGPVPVRLGVFSEWDRAVQTDARLVRLGGPAGIDLDLGGKSLSVSATLSVDLGGAPNPDVTVLLVRSAEAAGTGLLELVSVGSVNGSIATFTGGDATFPTSGITSGGRYYIVGVAGPLGFITGRVQKNGADATGVLVSTGGLPFVSFTRVSDAAYVLVAPAGSAGVTAMDLTDGADAQSLTTITRGGLSVVNLYLMKGAPLVTSVTPSDNARGVDPAASLTVRFNRAMAMATLTADTLTLKGQGGAALAGAVRVSADGASVTFTPFALLAEAAAYTLTVSGAVTDSYGNALGSDHASTFHTINKIAPAKPAIGEVTAAEPVNGRSVVTGNLGAAPAKVLVIATNFTTGESVTVTSLADGSYSLTIAALVTDRLGITYRDPDGNETTFSPGPFRTEDGAYIVGSTGGTVPGPSGIYAIVPEGAVPEGTKIKLAPISAAELPKALPPDFEFLGGIDLDMGDVVATKELKLSIANPEGSGLTPQSQVFVFKEIEVAGQPEYSLNNIARLADGRLTTASPPFPGAMASSEYLWVKPLIPMQTAQVYLSESYIKNIDALDYGGVVFGWNLATRLYVEILAEMQSAIIISPVDRGFSVAVADFSNGSESEPVNFPPIPSLDEIAAIYLPSDIELGIPNVISRSPSNNLTNVPVERGIQVLFDKPVLKDGIKVTVTGGGDSFEDIIDEKKSQTGLASAVDYADGGPRFPVIAGVTFIPSSRLQYDTDYTVTLSGVNGQIEKDVGNGKKEIELVPLPDCQKTFTFHTFCPRFLGSVGIATPSDIAVYDDNRIVVANGKAGIDPDSQNKGVVIVGTSIPARLKRIGAEHNISGNTLGVAVPGGPSGYSGVVAVSGGNNYISQVRYIDMNMRTYRRTLISMDSVSLVNGITVNNIPPYSGIPLAVSVVGGVAFVANLGVGLQSAPIASMTSDWKASLGNNVEPGLNVLNAQNGTIDNNNGFLNFGWQIPTPRCIAAMLNLLFVGDMKTLWILSAVDGTTLGEMNKWGVNTYFDPEKQQFKSDGSKNCTQIMDVEAVAGFPAGGAASESKAYSGVVFAVDREGNLLIHGINIDEVTGAVSAENSVKVPENRLTFASPTALKAAAKDRLLYVADSRGINVVDVANLSEPRILGRVKGAGKADFTGRVNDIDLGLSFGFAAVPGPEDNGSVVSFPIRSCIESIKRDGDHKSPGDKEYHIGNNEAANFKAIKSPGVANIVWSIVETAHVVKSEPVRAQLAPNGDSCVVNVDKESGSGWILLRAANADIPSCYMDRQITIGCQSCTTGCENKVGGSCDAKNSCVNVSFNLGRAAEGLSAGELTIHAIEPDEMLGSPGGLSFSANSDSVKVIYGDKGEVRQIIAPETFVKIEDVVAEDKIEPLSYKISFYSPSAVGPLGTDGFYTMSLPAAPVKAWIVKDPGGKGELLTVTENSTGNHVYSYAWSEAAQDWTLTSGSGDDFLVNAKSNSEDPLTHDRILTEKVSGKGGVASVTKTWFHKYPWGEEPVKIVTDPISPDNPAGANLTETITYYDGTVPFGNSSETGSYGKIFSRVQPDGSWVAYQYDDHGRVTREFRPWLSGVVDTSLATTRAVSYNYSPVDAAETVTPESFWEPRVVTETVLGVVTSKTFHARIKAADGAITEISEQAWAGFAAYGDTRNLRTVTSYYSEAEGEAFSGKLKSVLSPDGKLTTYAYDYGVFDGVGTFTQGGGRWLKTTVTHGTELSPAGIANKTTREVSIENPTGVSVYSESEVYDGSAYARVSWSRNTLDAQNRVVRTDNSDGTFTATAWDCCHKASETDAEGITTTFTYDPLDRVISQIRDGLGGSIVTDFVLDALGREISRRVTAGGISQATSTAYDSAGRQISTTDEAGLVTTYQYSENGLISTVVQPGGATQVTESFKDGRTRSVTGSGVTPQYYEYGVNPDGTQWTKTSMVMLGSAMWEKTTTDLFGRTVKTEKPGFGGLVETVNFYDYKGRLAKTSATGRAGTLTVYDELGEVRYTALDVNANGVIDLGGPDRVQSSESLYVLDGGAWWRSSSQSVFADASGAATVTGASKQRLTGLGASGLTGESQSIDVNGNVTISRSYLDSSEHRRTTVTDYPDSDTDETSVTRFGLTVSATSKTNVTTTFIYDALGRQTGVTDQRKGTSTTHYDAKGRVDWVADAAGFKTFLTYDEVTGRTIAQTDALGHTTRTGYDAKGNVVHVWGDATYPVSYEYDVYGRKTEMRTYRTSGVDWNSESWPDNAGAGDVTTWIYDPASGLLTNKNDNSGAGPTYTYTVDGKLLTRKWARTDAAGNDLVTTYSYDSQTGELTGVDYSDSTPDVTCTYDRLGRQQQITDAAGTRVFSYNADFSLASEAITGIYDKVIARSYDSAPGVKGRYAGFSVGAGYSVSYGYDQKGRMNQVSWNVGGSGGIGGVPHRTDYTYLANSDLLAEMSTVRTDGQNYTPVSADYAYEPHRDVKTIVHNHVGARTISQYDYRYNAIGNRTSVVNTGEAFGSQYVATSPENREGFNLYSYNSRSEVTESKRYSGTDVDNPVDVVKPEYRAYNYDPIGNRTSAVEGNETQQDGKATSYDSNGLNQYKTTTVTPNNNESATFTYDADGNMTSISDATGYTLYVFDGENRLIEVRPQTPQANQKKVAFAYDFMGRRISKSVSSWNNNAWSPALSRTFTWDGWLMTDETVTTSSLTPETTSYVWGLDLSQTLNGAGGVGGLLSMSSEGSNSFNCYLYDANGNVTQLVNSNSDDIFNCYEYDAYGKILEICKGSHAVSNQFNFSTKYSDNELNQTFFGYRYYALDFGRWINRDPAEEEKGGANLYCFVNNNSLQLYDILGLSCCNITINIDQPSDEAVVENNVLNVAEDPGHTWLVLDDGRGNETKWSFGPITAIGIFNKNAFLNGNLPGNAEFSTVNDTVDVSKTWELDDTHCRKAKDVIEEKKALFPYYTPSYQCTSSSLDILNSIPVDPTPPSGVGHVIARVAMRTFWEGDVANPYHLAIQLFGTPLASGVPSPTPSPAFPQIGNNGKKK